MKFRTLQLGEGEEFEGEGSWLAHWQTPSTFTMSSVSTLRRAAGRSAVLHGARA